MEALDEFIAACEAGASHTNESSMRGLRGSVRRARGDEAEPSQIIEGPSSSRASRATCASSPRLDDLRHTHADRGELERARALADEAIPIIRETGHARGGVAELIPFLDPLGIREHLGCRRWMRIHDATSCGDRRRLAPRATSVRRRARLADRQRWMEAVLRLSAGEKLIASENGPKARPS